MAKAFYSVVLDRPADDVWTVIRSFARYDWSGVVSETVIEDGKAGDQVGAIRRVRIGDRVIRQRLLAHSDADRSYSYAFLSPLAEPVRNYQATIQVLPVVENDQAFVQWWATFDCGADEPHAGSFISPGKDSRSGWPRFAGSWPLAHSGSARPEQPGQRRLSLGTSRTAPRAALVAMAA